ncbi:MAG: TolB family protein, partial [Planctomycetota bacterium]
MTIPESIPLEVLFGNPTNVGPRLSPDGRSFIYLAPDEGVMNVWVRSLDGSDARVLTHDRGNGIYIHFWSEDGKYVLFMQDKEGDENFRFFAVDLETEEERCLTPFPDVMAFPLESHPKFPDVFLINMNRRDKRFFDAYRMNIHTGALDLEMENPGNVDKWIVDTELKVRGVWRTVPGGFRLDVPDEGGDWRELAAFGGDDDHSMPL